MKKLLLILLLPIVVQAQPKKCIHADLVPRTTLQNYDVKLKSDTVILSFAPLSDEEIFNNQKELAAKYLSELWSEYKSKCWNDSIGSLINKFPVISKEDADTLIINLKNMKQKNIYYEYFEDTKLDNYFVLSYRYNHKKPDATEFLNNLSKEEK
jgi:hypothetical protein